MAVDLGRIVQNDGRLIQERVSKECPCVYGETRTTQTWRTIGMVIVLKRQQILEPYRCMEVNV